MRVTAKVDYAVRALVVLSRADPAAGLVRGDEIAAAQEIPVKFLENILSSLRQAGIVRSQRGAEGGYGLALPAEAISIADVIRAVEGPLAHVRGEAPEDLAYPEGTGSLQALWVATRAALRSVLEETTVADLAAGHLPPDVQALADGAGAWERPWLRRR